mgnify:CR=1 FL=1
MERHTLSVLVEDVPGTLTRVAGLFARRAFNIHSLAVGVTEVEGLSRITVVVDADTDTLLGATFVGPEFAELAQAATLAVVAKVPIETLRHVVAPHPSVNQVWNPLLARRRSGSHGPA